MNHTTLIFKQSVKATSHMPTAVLAFSFLLCFITNSISAQITIQKYAKELSCDVGALADLPTIQAESQFGGLVVRLNEEIFSGGCLGTLVRTFEFEDKIGEKASAIQIVHITDILPPDLIGVPANTSVSEEKIPPVFPIDARDNSGIMCEVLFEETKEKNKIIRKWSATDTCGNTAEAHQIITIR